MPTLKENIQLIQSSIPQDVQLIAVTKTKPIELLLEAYDANLRVFAESRVQELLIKYEKLPKDIEWHLIGHLQTNKVKSIVSFVAMIQSVDSINLLKEINKEASKVNRIIKCLLEVHIAQEDAKFGFSIDEVVALFENKAFDEYKNIEICGLMGMATYTDNETQIKKEFLSLKKLFDEIKTKYSQKTDFTKLSMGMSGDYHLAIECGSNMVRIGTTLFGER